MSDFTIEKGVPLETPRRGAYTSYPFGEMSIDDSFFIEYMRLTATECITAEKRVRIAATAYGRRHNVLFTIRKVEGGLRVWRTK